MREDLFAFSILTVGFSLREDGGIPSDLFPSIVSYLTLYINLFVQGISLRLQDGYRFLIIRSLEEPADLWSQISQQGVKLFYEPLCGSHCLL